MIQPITDKEIENHRMKVRTKLENKQSFKNTVLFILASFLLVTLITCFVMVLKWYVPVILGSVFGINYIINKYI